MRPPVGSWTRDARKLSSVAIAKQDGEAVGIGLVMLALIGLGCLYGWWEEVTSAHRPPRRPGPEREEPEGLALRAAEARARRALAALHFRDEGPDAERH